MGSSFDARCENCGYQAHGLIGGGMQNHMYFCSWPSLCLSCEEIATVNMKATPLRCEGCGAQEVTPYLGQQASLSRQGPYAERRTVHLKDGTMFSVAPSGIQWGDLTLDTLRRWACPKCQALSVAFEEGGMLWD